MKKDLESFRRHDRGYNDLDFESVKQGLDKGQKYKPFEIFGFQHAVEKNPNVRQLHIDIGSGNGWLLRYTNKLFQKVIGIEPSAKAIEFAKRYNPNAQNIEYLNMDMVDALSQLNLSVPYFATTAAVFCHIQDYYVAQALKIINQAPTGSVVLFCEPYDKNIQQPFWYVRSQEWWRQQMPCWDLDFLGLTVGGNGKKENYKKGIYGVCRGTPSAFTQRGKGWQIYWKFNGFYYKSRYALVKSFKKLMRVKMPAHG